MKIKYLHLMILLGLCCTLSAQIINENNLEVVHVLGCDPLAKTGSIEIHSVSGGSLESYTYQWEKTGGGEFAGQNTPKISYLDTGRYVVTVTDMNNIMISESRIITITAPDVITITDVELQDVLCKGDFTGKITAHVTGGDASLNYILLNEDKTPNGNVTGASSGVFTGLSADIYHLAVRNSVSCTDTVKVSINEPEEHLTLSVVQTGLVSCAYGNDGALFVTIKGGVSNYTLYIKDASDNIINTIGDLEADTYTFDDLNVDNHTTVSIMDANYCTTSTVVDVREMRKPEMLEPEIEEINCFNDKGVVYIRAKAYNEGSSNNNIEKYWIKGEIFQETDPSPDFRFDNLNGGTYYLYAQDSYGCIGEKEIFLSEPESPVELIPKKTVQPHGDVMGSITFTASGGREGYTIECKKVELGYHELIERLVNKPVGDYTFGNLNVGEYQFTIEDREGCPGTHHLVRLDKPTSEIDPETAGLKIFPNPSGNGKFIIEWKHSEDRKVTLELYSITGQLIYKTNAQTGTRVMLDVSNQERGTYLLHVPELNMIQKLIIN